MCVGAPKQPKQREVQVAAPVPVQSTETPELEVGEERLDSQERTKRAMRRGTKSLQTGLNIPTYGSGSGINIG
jgi:hypothetical protein|tara:strand:+ start:74 stop:292 length:219 start_codon:yes stop_codon:yes gene_type:complete